MFLKYQNNQFFFLPSALCALCFSCVFLSGCSTAKKIQHLPQLLTLKSYSDSQGSIKKEAEQADKMFDEIVVEIEAGQFDYQTAVEVQKRFGEPVFKREAEYQGQMCEQWLYRYTKDFEGASGKVYLYFNNERQLINFEYIKGQKTEDQ